jgi:hypothetical protein
MIDITKTLCESCQKCGVDKYRMEPQEGYPPKMVILGFGCGKYGFNRSFNKGFMPRKKRCKHYDENY